MFVILQAATLDAVQVGKELDKFEDRGMLRMIEL